MGGNFALYVCEHILNLRVRGNDVRLTVAVFAQKTYIHTVPSGENRQGKERFISTQQDECSHHNSGKRLTREGTDKTCLPRSNNDPYLLLTTPPLSESRGKSRPYDLPAVQTAATTTVRTNRGEG